MVPDIIQGRIKSKLKNLFENKLPKKDGNFVIDENKFLSMSLAGLAIMMKTGIDENEAIKYITDGFGDCGIDALYYDEKQEKLFIIQSKFSNGNNGIQEGDILKFIAGISQILNLKFDDCNDKIKFMRNKIETALDKAKIYLILIHNSSQNLPPVSLKHINDFVNSTNSDGIEILKFEEVKNKDIYEFLCQENIKEMDCILNNWGNINEPYRVYYGILSAKQLGSWYEEYGNLLFSQNIRFYKENTEVNAGIKEVLKNEPENFFYYNNGIKILCSSVERTSVKATTKDTGTFKLKGVSIINGAQTTGAIGEIYKENRDLLENVKVFVQLIEINENSKNIDKNTITKLSNTQNSISSKDFVSLDSNQARLKNEFENLGYEYVYKSGSKEIPNDKKIVLDELIIALTCMQEDIKLIAVAKGRVGDLTGNNDYYTKLFNERTNAISAINAVKAIRIIQNIIDELKKLDENKELLGILVHGNRFIAYLILQDLNSDNQLLGQIQEFNKENIKLAIIQKCYDILNIVRQNNEWDEKYYNIFKTINKCESIYRELQNNMC
ncbi:AIPR family protein [Campylobacter sp. VBCF_06 NA8]|uniref:AIPR family protein n=1 Tax=Campylobacter sp. VBCF_06 NA8 TaxID=2983822 RepID=UPI0022E9B9F5|nr:AIPR family protein [Campylobacter sp. VBCF_06 NA8]MDA3047108.1 AIPR family protein [Campylobacter sp. VBCF_06 NA8]